VPQLVNDSSHNPQAALVFAARVRWFSIRDPPLISTRAHVKQLGLSWLANRSELGLEPKRNLLSVPVLANGLTVGDPREQKAHLLKRKP
jgi:hypothetical protein